MPLLRVIFFLTCTTFLGGCGSIGLLTVDERENVAVGNMDVTINRFQALAARVKAGEVIDRKSALLALGIPDERHATIESLRRIDIQSYLFGGASIFAGDTKVIDLLDHTTGVRIPFKGRQEHIVLSSGVYITTKESGYDFSIVLIFRDGVIRDADQVGVLSISRSTKRVIWNPANSITTPSLSLIR